MGYANVIDNNHTLYNLSAWLGGYYDEDDSMTASLTFLNDLFQTIGTQIILGPVLAIDRASTTKLLYREQTGLAPQNTRYLTVSLVAKRYSGSYCDAYADNISLVFQHN